MSTSATERAWSIEDRKTIARAFSDNFSKHEVKPQSVLWPNAKDLVQRFHALTSAIQWSDFSVERPLRVLDVGCGPGFLLDFFETIGVLEKVRYVGVDLVEEIVEVARRRWPGHQFSCRDIILEPFTEERFDYAVFCGVFTCKFSLTHQSMTSLMEGIISTVWSSVLGHLAFNVMSIHVDWERDDLFHCSVDSLLEFAVRGLATRNVKILNDYGLYEYSCLVFRTPNLGVIPTPASWL